MDEFKALHGQQLEMMGVPDDLHPIISSQLEATFFPASNVSNPEIETTNDKSMEEQQLKANFTYLSESSINNFEAAKSITTNSENNPLRIIVTPHILSFDIHANISNGLQDALFKLSLPTLSRLRDELLQEKDLREQNESKEGTIDSIIPLVWNRLVLYKDTNQNVMAALPFPPYPKYTNIDENLQELEQSNIMGPFPFAYIHPRSMYTDPINNIQEFTTFCSISFVTVDDNDINKTSIEIRTDPIPDYSCPDPSIRTIRLAAIFGDDPPPYYATAAKQMKQHYAEFVRKMHFVRQAKLESPFTIASTNRNDFSPPSPAVPQIDDDSPLIVYTDENDFMSLTHPEGGLSDPRFKVTQVLPSSEVSSDDIQIVFSSSSVFSPKSPFYSHATNKAGTKQEKKMFFNQFPYEGTKYYTLFIDFLITSHVFHIFLFHCLLNILSNLYSLLQAHFYKMIIYVERFKISMDFHHLHGHWKLMI